MGLRDLFKYSWVSIYRLFELEKYYLTPTFFIVPNYIFYVTEVIKYKRVFLSIKEV